MAPRCAMTPEDTIILCCKWAPPVLQVPTQRIILSFQTLSFLGLASSPGILDSPQSLSKDVRYSPLNLLSLCFISIPTIQAPVRLVNRLLPHVPASNLFSSNTLHANHPKTQVSLCHFHTLKAFLSHLQLGIMAFHVLGPVVFSAFLHLLY